MMTQNSRHIARRMRRLSFLATGMLWIKMPGAHAAPKAENGAVRMPRGSYLRKPVHSTTQLVSQFASDPIVVQRYSRVFNLSPENVKTALRAMKLTPLKNDMVMNVYYVRPGEHLGFRVRRVKKGTMVFTLPDGTPALVQACGNPLRHTLIPPKTAKIPDFNPDEALPTENLEAQPLPEQSGVTRLASSVATAPPMVNATPPSELEAAAEIVTVAGAGSSGASADFIEDIAALPLGFIGAGGGGAAGGALAAGLTKALLIAGTTATIGNFVSNSGGSTPSSGGTPPGGSPPSGGTPPGGGKPPTGGDTPPSGSPGLVPEWNANLLFLFALAGAGVPAYLRKRREQQTL